MAEIINLNKVRKERARAAKTALAKQNRIVFGRTKTEKAISEKTSMFEVSRIDGHRLDDHDRP